MTQIKNIIFDFGGVLFDLDIQKSFDAFQALCDSEMTYQSALAKIMEAQVLQQYEIGKISTPDFIKAFQQHLSPKPSATEVQNAWSAMLLGIRADRIEFLKTLRKSGYKLYLLSNINDIHLHETRKSVEQHCSIEEFENLFEKIYYSHLIGMRKPNIEIYEHVLKDAQITAAESVFIDDMPENLKGAQKAGLHTLLQKTNANIMELVENYLSQPIKN